MNEPLPAEDNPVGEGQRLHPLGLIVGLITGLPQLIFPMVAAVFGTGSRDRPELIPVVILAVLLISVFFRWLAWLRTHYHVGDDDIRIERGILNRSARSIPYDRIQDVSVEQKLLARLLGIGEVKFETGGGEGDDAKLSYVSLDEAERLRETVRARKAGVATPEASAGAVPEPDLPPVFAMDTRRLVILGFYSFSLVIFAILGGLAQQFDFLLPFDWWDFKNWIGIAEDNGVDITHIDRSVQIGGAIIALLALTAIGFATGIVRTFLKEYGFRLDRTAKGFRRRRGLTTLTDVVMPVARVQAAQIETGPIRKLSGWHALKFVSLAQESKDESHHMVAPLAQMDEIEPIMAEAGIALPSTEAQFRRAPLLWWGQGLVYLWIAMAIGTAATIIFADAPFSKAGWMLIIPLAFVPLVWLEWRNYGDLVDESQIYLRENWWNQQFSIAPQVKVQSAEVSQGPLARLFGLATLHFGIAGGSLRFAALPLEDALAVRDRIMDAVAPVDFSEINRRG
ncbi:PH domain-containing protein [Sphingorhabdus sp.]|uniref:PH domain-containing protein n=1 Tax=Sphingorhabdus sp. TaxID=1902408 RepID=UPI0035B2ACF9